MKRGFALLLVVVFSVSVMVSCQKSGGDSGVGVEKSHFQRVLEKGKIVVGITLSFPPFGMKNTKGEPEGYDVDLAKALAESLAVELEIVDIVGEARIPNLETDKIDIMLGNFTRTLTRAQKVDFTAPYVVAAQRLIVRQDSAISKIEDLQGKSVAVIKGSTNAEVIKNSGVNANVSFLATGAEGILAVRNGQNDAFIEDSNFLQYQASMNPDLKVVGDPLSLKEYNAFGIRKGDQDWLNYLNLFLYEINNISGKNDELYRKWFGADRPYKLNPEY